MKTLKWMKGFFYGNYFYGICIVTLAIESSLQLNLPLNNPLFYIALFSATVLFYTHTYYVEINHILKTVNERSVWYYHHKKLIEKSQLFLTATTCILVLLIFNGLQPHFSKVSKYAWLILAIFGLLLAAYYKSLYKSWGSWGLRKNGIIKPIVIGLVWTGAFTFTPVFFYDLSYPNSTKTLELFTWLLFIKNFLFIYVLCILFDIKDYACDANQQIKTWVVQFGLRRTLYWVIFPLTILSWVMDIVFSKYMNFTFNKILFNSIPFVLLIIVSYSMQQRKSILYYLAIIDGLMLVKAIFGITSMLLTK